MDENSAEDNSPIDTKALYLTHGAGIRRSRKIFNFDTQQISSSENDDDYFYDLEVLMNKTWNIIAVSTMFDFQFNDKVLMKQYAKKLREEVARVLSKNDVSYEAQFKVLDINTLRKKNHPILQITVTAVVIGKEDKETCVYNGYFFSEKSETINLPSSNKVKLPLLLCRGTTNTIQTVHATLCRMFDCMFLELPFTPDDLVWILSIFVRTFSRRSRNNAPEVMLEYAIPNLPKSNSITVKFEFNDLINLWKSYYKEDDKILVEEVEKFYEALQEHVMDVSGLHLGLCILNKINLWSISASQGKMKVMNIEAMIIVLTYLNEKASEAFHVNM